VARLRRAHKIIIGELQFLCESLPVHRKFIAIVLRRFALRKSNLLHLLAVLVQTRQEKYLLAEAPPRPGDDVCSDLFIGMAEVRLAVDVINRGGDVKPFAHLREGM